MLPPVSLDVPALYAEHQDDIVATCSEVARPRTCAFNVDSTIRVSVQQTSDDSVLLRASSNGSEESLELKFRPEDALDARASSIGLTAAALSIRLAPIPRSLPESEAGGPEKQQEEETTPQPTVTGEVSLRPLSFRVVKPPPLVSGLLFGYVGSGLSAIQYGGGAELHALPLPLSSKLRVGPFVQGHWGSQPDADGLSAQFRGLSGGAALQWDARTDWRARVLFGVRSEWFSPRLAGGASVSRQVETRTYTSFVGALDAEYGSSRFAAFVRAGASTTPQISISIADEEVAQLDQVSLFFSLGARISLF